jgi:hypothetical protein
MSASTDTRREPISIPAHATGSSIHAAITVTTPGSASICTNRPEIRCSLRRRQTRRGQRAHAALDHVGVDLNPAVGEEQAQAGPPGEGVADRLSQPALLAHQGELLAQPGLERLHQCANPPAAGPTAYDQRVTWHFQQQLYLS